MTFTKAIKSNQKITITITQHLYSAKIIQKHSIALYKLHISNGKRTNLHTDTHTYIELYNYIMNDIPINDDFNIVS